MVLAEQNWQRPSGARRRGKSSQLRPEGGGGAPSQNQNPVFLTLSHVCHVSSPPSLLQVYQSARVDGLLIFSIIPTKLKTAGECPR